MFGTFEMQAGPGRGAECLWQGTGEFLRDQQSPRVEAYLVATDAVEGGQGRHNCGRIVVAPALYNDVVGFAHGVAPAVDRHWVSRVYPAIC